MPWCHDHRDSCRRQANDGKSAGNPRYAPVTRYVALRLRSCSKGCGSSLEVRKFPLTHQSGFETDALESRRKDVTIDGKASEGATDLARGDHKTRSAQAVGDSGFAVAARR